VSRRRRGRGLLLPCANEHAQRVFVGIAGVSIHPSRRFQRVSIVGGAIDGNLVCNIFVHRTQLCILFASVVQSNKMKEIARISTFASLLFIG